MNAQARTNITRAIILFGEKSVSPNASIATTPKPIVKDIAPETDRSKKISPIRKKIARAGAHQRKALVRNDRFFVSGIVP
jgi:hypothetical protein